jgi:hypothetical protein
MRWEITVTTHLFVTCRTGFHSAAGEVASRPGRGGRPGAGGGTSNQQHRVPSWPVPPALPGTSQPGGIAFANGSFTGSREGKDNVICTGARTLRG